MIIIGSSAIKHHYPDFNREPKDIDVVKTSLNEELPLFDKRVEILTNPVLVKYFSHEQYLNPDALYTLKVSHLVGWTINWDKHMWDMNFLQSKGAKLDLQLVKEFYDYFCELHGQPHKSNLDMTADDFFDNAITYPLEHDRIHEILNPSPVYKKILVQDGLVTTSEAKWNDLSFQDKCDLIREETMVMAIERFSHLSYKQAYTRMLKKLIINHLPFYEGLFAVENYLHIHKPQFNFIQTINQNGKINHSQIA